MGYEPIPKGTERITGSIADAACAVHSALGPRLLERVYEVCFCRELARRGFAYRRQVVVPIAHDGLVFDEGIRLDVLVEEEVFCESKAVNRMDPITAAQVLS